MRFENIKENDFIIIFKNYGKEFEKRKVIKNNGYCLELENGEKIYSYNTNKDKIDVIKYEEDIFKKQS